MGKLVELLLTIDFKTAGWKTYLGLALISLAVILHHLGQIDADAFEKLAAGGAVIALGGKMLADKRKRPQEPGAGDADSL